MSNNFILVSNGADQKGPPPQKSKNIWPALAGYIFSKDLDDFM
jgi:hypothetical protein